MTIKMTRRCILVASAAGAAGMLVSRIGVQPAGAGGIAQRAVDPRVEALVALSRDESGAPHVARAAFVNRHHVAGTLRISRREADILRRALATGDFSTMQSGGLRVGGHKFVFVREDDGTLYAARRGERLTARAAGTELVVATSEDTMSHGRAASAMHRYSQSFVELA